MKLSPDGRFLATASEKGTLIRVFDTKSAEKTTEVRRGADSALISDVLIDPTNAFIACASDKGTVHIFNMKQGDENKKSSLSALGGYFNSEWSFGQFKVKDMNCKVALFDDKIFAVSTAGNYYYGNITKDAIKIEKQEELLKEGEEE
uniref:Uncharacterized protein n=1 Tax=Strombidium inclinatum TaxID=197538 RepID=A0A7S3N2Y3_9SPIT|mmetsp:Transcript_3799/g.5738  ORF Transcript_3799/g.5738 Transcript_3799/m.5738 type:complete len:147 (+) Transcript_3799:603-1043(+)